METNAYILKKLNLINKAESNDEKIFILNSFYSEGFADGAEEAMTSG